MHSSVVSFRSLKSELDEAISAIADPRQPSNATSYSLRDVVLGAFGCFFMQSASFLDYQRQLNSRHGKDNAQSLFGLGQIPSVEQIRNILDQILASHLSGVFEQVYGRLYECGYLKGFEVLDGHLLVALDGTEYYSSQTLSCPCCSQRKSRNGTVTYSHKAILPTLVSPHQSAVVSLAPVFITPQDGHTKQDSEPAAAKRWLKQSLKRIAHQPITLLGDDLYSRQPMCETVLAEQADFIFTCLSQSHPVLSDWIDFNTGNGKVSAFEWQPPQRTDEVWQIRYLSDVPLNGSETALSVNWCELTVRRSTDERVLYCNSWVTSHNFDSHQKVIDIVCAGRSRWKTENENHNVLKTKGYHLDHNFGHGQANLASVLLSLNLLAFLFHTVLEWSDCRYQKMRQRRGTRKGFFQDILALTQYLWFDSWDALLNFMLDDSKAAKPITNSS